MNGYKAFYNGKETEVWADTSLQARDKAVAFWKVKPMYAYKVTVVLCEKKGEQVVHRPLD
jgi:hypothetical protein